MNIIKVSILPLALIASISIAQADVYKSVNKEGVVEYSDQPSKNSEKIKVRNPQSVTLPKGSSSSSDANQSSDNGSPYTSIVITQPAQDSAFNSGNGQVSISSETTPSLTGSDSIQLILDGTAYGDNKNGTFTLTNVDRGTHQAQVNIVDGSGKVLNSSEITTFTLHRPNAGRPRPTPRGN